MTQQSLRMLFAMMLTASLLCGCLGKNPKEARVLWPPPPELARLEFVGVYASQDDYPKTRWQKFVERLAGKDLSDTLKAPQGIYVDTLGKVYVSDTQLRNVQVFDFHKKTVEPLLPNSVLANPLDLERDNNGNFYVLDGKQRKVFVFSSEGVLLHSFGGEQLLPRPEFLAINDQMDRLYVSDTLSNRIAVFDLRGKHLFSFGRAGNGDGEFDEPHGIIMDSEGWLFVADTGNARIQVFDADGNFLYKFGERGQKVWNFLRPRDLAFDSSGNLYILDHEMLSVFVYTPGGEALLVAGTGKTSNKPLGFASPNSIYIDHRDRIYVSDRRNKRFTVWQYLSQSYLEDKPITADDLEKLQKTIEAKRGKAVDSDT